MSSVGKLALYAVIAVVAAGLGLLAATRWSTPPAPEQALMLERPRPLPEFALTDHTGVEFGPARLRGHWTFLFFGFTHCPDICPTTLQTLAQARAELEDLPAAQRPAVVMVSVDPGRDTPAQLAGYVPYFDPEFLGVVGAEDALRALTGNLGVAYGYTPDADGEGYTVDHTAAIFLVDPAGRLAAVFGTPHNAERIAADYRAVLAAAG
jgi:protein SCO1/2